MTQKLASAATATPAPVAARVATRGELAAAQAVWAVSRHANTYDTGLGANTTCASCKSPQNWDPAAIAAQEAAHDCASCKREPGKPRPELAGGVPVPQSEWQSIGCDVCHEPVGNSYSTAISFWNQQSGAYEPVENSTELCGKCHEGSHGFEVIWEQANSPAHRGWDCTRCHGSHGSPVTCADCHDMTIGRGAQAHAQHPEKMVNCTACHDAAGLGIWQDPNAGSRHYGTYAPQRFGHALRSWPSHDIQAAVDCRRCHHPQGDVMPKPQAMGAAPRQAVVRPAVVSQTLCDNRGCHPGGATFEWCPIFPRDPTPEAQKP